MRIWLIKVLFNSVDSHCYSNVYKACMWNEVISPSAVSVPCRTHRADVKLTFCPLGLSKNFTSLIKDLCMTSSGLFLRGQPKIFISPPFFAERGELCIDPWFLFSILQLQIYRDSLALPLFQRGHIFKFVKFPKEYNLRMLFKNVMA